MVLRWHGCCKRKVSGCTTAVRRADHDANLVLYAGGSHHVAEKGRPSFRVDYFNRLVEWIERWTREPDPHAKMAKPRVAGKSSIAQAAD
jgi:hypothetical protein